MTMFASQWLANAGATYEIDQSIRFNDDDSAYLSRTPGSAGDRRTFTFSCWFKRANITSANAPIFSAGGDDWLMFLSANTLGFNTSGSNYRVVTTQVFRDPAAWTHLVLRVDTTNGTAGDRLRLYLNGSEVTAFGTDTNPTLNFETSFNNTGEHDIGKLVGASQYFDGYLSEIHHVDGSSLAASSFGKTSSTTGQWIPKKYSGSYGTNGFYLKGESSSDLGNDSSGNNNDYSSSGLAAADQVIDTPTNNFATYSPINLDSVTLADGNLFCDSASYWSGAAATAVFPTSGKWYLENLVGNRFGSYACQGFIPANYERISIASEALYYASYGAFVSGKDYGLGVNMNQSKFGFYVGGSGTAHDIYKPDGSTSLYSTGDLYICHALDLDNERYWIGTALTTDSSVTWYGPSGSGADPTDSSTGVDISSWLDVYGSKYGGLLWFHSANQTSGTPDSTIDFGQSGFKFTKPTGYGRLCTADLSDPAIADPSKYFQSTTYTGNGSTQSINQSGNSTFQPDWVWIKNRDAADSHIWTDAVRGATKILESNDADAEVTDADTLTGFESDGFALGDDDKVNTNTENYIAWQWKANGAGSSNEDGTINTTATSVNTTTGVSISTYTGTGSNATVGHGLGVAPKMVIVKRRNTSESWRVWHTAMTDGSYFMNLENTDGQASIAAIWNSTAPTSSVVSVGTNASVNGSSDTHVMYAFADVEGFSKFAAYTGNGNADGPFVHTGFKPAFLMFKVVSTTDSWQVYDTARQDYNVFGRSLTPNANAVESSFSARVDLLSNGFKARSTNTAVNGSGQTYLFMAFAEAPFKTATAR